MTTTKIVTDEKLKESIKSYDSYRKLNKLGQADGIATLDSEGHLPVDQMPTSALIYQGQWDASTGTYPADGTTPGDFYIVSKEGTVGGIEFNVNDWIIWSGTAWDKSTNSISVTSVNGKKGMVILAAADVGALPDDTHIPDDQVQADWTETDDTKVTFIKNKPTLADVATSGDFNDLLNKPYTTWVGTQAEYNAITEKDPNTIYFIEEA